MAGTVTASRQMSERRITVERRAEDEVTHVLGVPVAPDGTRALNCAFDVTPAALVTAVVTEDRVITAWPIQNQPF